MRPSFLFCLLACALLAAGPMVSCTCTREKPLEAADLRGLTQAQLQQMREEILARHADGSPLSSCETANVELLREQERRLDNGWVFGEWRERHGARLIFRDDGTVSVGARDGVYDELGVYKFISPEQPSFESVWRVVYDEEGNPVVLVSTPSGPDLIYPGRRGAKTLNERTGDLQLSSETGYYFTKI